MAQSTLDRVRSIVASVMDVEPEDVSAASCPETIENWDSMQHLNLVLDLEQSFRIKFRPAEIEKMKNVGVISALVEEKTVGQ